MTTTFRHFTARAVIWIILVALLTVGFIWLIARRVEAQEGAIIPCMPLKGAIQLHAAQYGEEPVATATATNGKAAFTLLLAPNGTFTLLITDTRGCTMRAAAGEDWRFDKPLPPGEDS